MEDAERKSLELEKQIDELREKFEAGIREKEEMFRSLGITPEVLAQFEQRLSPRDKKIMEELREKIDREIESRMAAQSEPAPASFKPPKGMRV